MKTLMNTMMNTMKSKKRVPLAALAVAAAVVNSGTAQAAVPRLAFEKPLVLTTPAVSVTADKVWLGLDDDTNHWVEDSCEKHTHQCALTLKIEGRDIAVKNQRLGEHYFGSMELDCDAGGQWFASGFKTKFSRVFFLGIRNCVESETTIDQDYCTITAVALRKETDLVMDQDLIRNDYDEREFYRITSDAGKSRFVKLGLAPDGLNLATVDSYQIFDLSIGRTGQEFFIKNPNSLSSFAEGRNYYLNPDSTSAGRDETLRKKVEERLDGLEDNLHKVPKSTSSKSAFDQALPGLIKDLSGTVKDLLAIISPVEFYRLEKRARADERELIALTQLFYPTITDRASFVRNYSDRFEDYGKIAFYFETGNSTKPVLEDETPTKPLQQDYAGKVFQIEDTSFNELFSSRGACSAAKNQCNAYLETIPSNLRPVYTCDYNNSWDTTYARYCRMTVLRQ